MKKVLITGADGFTGRYLALAMHEAGYEVHGLVHRPAAGIIPGVDVVHLTSLTDVDGLTALVRAVQPHKVVHLAAIAFVAHGDVDAIYRTNMMGTRCLLEALVKTNMPPDAVLLASSANVYGNALGGILDESTPPAPANDYAVSKLAMEYVARLYEHRLPLIITRPFNYTGVGQSESFLIPKIVGHVRSRAAVIELGNLHVTRSFSDVRTVVQYYRRLLEEPAAVGQTFNVCSDLAYTLDEVLTMVRALASYEFEVQVNPAFVRPNEVKTLIGSRTKLQSVVGTVTDIPFEDTLRWMVEVAA